MPVSGRKTIGITEPMYWLLKELAMVSGFDPWTLYSSEKVVEIFGEGMVSLFLWPGYEDYDPLIAGYLGFQGEPSYLPVERVIRRIAEDPKTQDAIVAAIRTFIQHSIYKMLGQVVTKVPKEWTPFRDWTTLYLDGGIRVHIPYPFSKYIKPGDQKPRELPDEVIKDISNVKWCSEEELTSNNPDVVSRCAQIYLYLPEFIAAIKLPKYMNQPPYVNNRPRMNLEREFIKVFAQMSRQVVGGWRALVDPTLMEPLYDTYKIYRRAMKELMELIYEFEDDPEVVMHVLNYLSRKYADTFLTKSKKWYNKHVAIASALMAMLDYQAIPNEDLKLDFTRSYRMYMKWRKLKGYEHYKAGKPVYDPDVIVNKLELDSYLQPKLPNETVESRKQLLDNLIKKGKMAIIEENGVKYVVEFYELTIGKPAFRTRAYGDFNAFLYLDKIRFRFPRRLVTKYIHLLMNNAVGIPLFRADPERMYNEYRALITYIEMSTFDFSRLGDEERRQVINKLQDIFRYFLKSPFKRTSQDYERLLQDLDYLLNKAPQPVRDFVRKKINRRIYITVPEETWQKLNRLKQIYKARNVDEAILALLKDFYSIHKDVITHGFNTLYQNAEAWHSLMYFPHNAYSNSHATCYVRDITLLSRIKSNRSWLSVPSNVYNEIYRAASHILFARVMERVQNLRFRKEVLDVIGYAKPRPQLSCIFGRKCDPEEYIKYAKELVEKGLASIVISDTQEPAILVDKVVIPSKPSMSLEDWLHEADKVYEQLSYAFTGIMVDNKNKFYASPMNPIALLILKDRLLQHEKLGPIIKEIFGDKLDEILNSMKDAVIIMYREELGKLAANLGEKAYTHYKEIENDLAALEQALYDQEGAVSNAKWMTENVLGEIWKPASPIAMVSNPYTSFYDPEFQSKTLNFGDELAFWEKVYKTRDNNPFYKMPDGRPAREVMLMSWHRVQSYVMSWAIRKIRKLAEDLLRVDVESVKRYAMNLGQAVISQNLAKKYNGPELTYAAYAVALSTIYAKFIAILYLINHGARFYPSMVTPTDLLARFWHFMLISSVGPLYYYKIGDDDIARYLLSPLQRFNQETEQSTLMYNPLFMFMITPILPGNAFINYIAWLMDSAWIGFLWKVRQVIEDVDIGLYYINIRGALLQVGPNIRVGEEYVVDKGWYTEATEKYAKELRARLALFNSEVAHPFAKDWFTKPFRNPFIETYIHVMMHDKLSYQASQSERFKDATSKFRRFRQVYARYMEAVDLLRSQKQAVLDNNLDELYNTSQKVRWVHIDPFDEQMTLYSFFAQEMNEGASKENPEGKHSVFDEWEDPYDLIIDAKVPYDFRPVIGANAYHRYAIPTYSHVAVPILFAYLPLKFASDKEHILRLLGIEGGKYMTQMEDEKDEHRRFNATECTTLPLRWVTVTDWNRPSDRFVPTCDGRYEVHVNLLPPSLYGYSLYEFSDFFVEQLMRYYMMYSYNVYEIISLVFAMHALRIPVSGFIHYFNTYGFIDDKRYMVLLDYYRVLFDPDHILFSMFTYRTAQYAGISIAYTFAGVFPFKSYTFVETDDFSATMLGPLLRVASHVGPGYDIEETYKRLGLKHVFEKRLLDEGKKILSELTNLLNEKLSPIIYAR